MIFHNSVAVWRLSMYELVEWLLEQKGWVIFGFAILLYVILLVMWFGFNLFWPWGFGLATVLAIVGPIMGGSKE
jgi:hypothetical protein